MKKFFLMILVLLMMCFSTFGQDTRTVTLTWDPNSEPDLSHYIVYWGVESGKYIVNSSNIGLVTTYETKIPKDGKKYFFAVTAVDTSGLESDFSNEVNTGESDIAIADAQTVPKKIVNLSLDKMALTGGGMKYVFENGKLTITRPDGVVIIIEKKQN